MNIEENLGLWCCKKSPLEHERKQEQSIQNFNNQARLYTNPLPQKVEIHAHPQSPKRVFSFRDHQCRVKSGEKIAPLQTPSLCQSRSHPIFHPLKMPPQMQEKPLNPVIFIKREENRIPQVSHLLSPRAPRLVDMRSPPSKISSNIYSLKIQSQKPKLKLTFSHSEAVNRKMQGKRIKTAEEETEYSSKHSQINFRNSNEGIESTNISNFQKKCSYGIPPKNPIFEDEMDDSRSLHQLQFPSCREVSAREEVDHSISNEFLQNTRSIQTIGTSNEMKSVLNSRRTSRQPSNAITFAKILPSPSPFLSPRHSMDIPECPTLRNSLSETPKAILSPIRQTSPSIADSKVQGPKLNSSIFYSDETSKKWNNSPKVSVLSMLDIDEKDNSDEEELRDVINHEFINSKGFSGTTSPFGSANQSLKNLEERKEKKVAFFRVSPGHSRDLSDELQLLKEIRCQQKRTNTFESMDSSNGEISCLDIKFMLKHRSRREVSKLIRQ